MNNKILAKAKARIDLKRQRNDEIAREEQNANARKIDDEMTLS